MSPAVGITRYAAFVPRLRLARGAISEAHAWALPGLKRMGKGERSFCSWDEDAITMAVQAGRDCIGAGSTAVAGLTFASTTAPFADLKNSAIVAGGLRLDESVPSQDVGGSTRSGLRALIAALEAGPQQHLVVASDCRRAKPGSVQELTYGAGAAALLTGGTDLSARYLGRQTLEAPFVDHFRQSGERYDYYWEERWIRDEGALRLGSQVVGKLLAKLDVQPERVALFGLTGAPGGCDRLLAKSLGIEPTRVLPDLQGTVGDCGTAHSLLQIVNALERAGPGDIVVVAAFGMGCEAVAFEACASGFKPVAGLAAAVANKESSDSYLRMLSFAGELQLDWGPRSETSIKAALTQQYRSASQLLGFVGGRCNSCGQVQFPVLPTCIACASTIAQAPFPLADAPARLATVSADWLQFYPAPPLYVGLVQFDAGARVLMEIVDVPRTGVAVGMPLRFAFRLKAQDDIRHYGRYFWKAVPTVQE